MDCMIYGNCDRHGPSAMLSVPSIENDALKQHLLVKHESKRPPSDAIKPEEQSGNATGGNLMMQRFVAGETELASLGLASERPLPHNSQSDPDDGRDNFTAPSHSLDLVSLRPGSPNTTHRSLKEPRNVGHSAGSAPLTFENVTLLSDEEDSRAETEAETIATAQKDVSPDELSTSESSPTESSRMTDDDFYSVVLSNERIRGLNDGLLQIFGQFIDSRLGIRTAPQHGSGSSSGQGPSDFDGINLHNNNARDGINNNKRRRRGNDDDEASGGGAGGNWLGPRGCKEDPVAKQKIACPFMKRSPEEFSTWRTCVGPGFDGLHRMKEHLKRRHFKEYSCQRCHLPLDSNRLLQTHIRSPEPCVLREVENEIGFMTQVQWDDINKRKGNRTSVLEKWKEIYVILFPEVDADSIPSPYFEPIEVMENVKAAFDIDEYSTHLGRHLPRRVFERLGEEFQIMSEAAKKRLVDILQEEALESLRSYVLQREASQKPESSAAIHSVERETLTWTNDMFEGIDFSAGGQLDFYFLAGDSEEDKGKGRADSAYGSNFMGVASELAPEETP
ncbi:hypothetical protein CPLU01_05849 [Colletotrichum plurivorum]|uniref:C2H2-type domain-containing protein n=1 Tax=Colletotrichum plurivorum TaxID=2175906 RepID=A0A8H6KKB2_9PEZI|nr:hypothetical protein CPLU01_05849 [Colletotrichum plurivorum]